MVRTGLFFDLRNPPAWARPWPSVYDDALGLVAEVDAHIDSIWLSEHHGFPDGYLPQPLVMAAAIAARTRHARIGTAVLLGAIRQPRHIAEQAAVVDILSGGRLDLGLGAGSGHRELGWFGVDRASRYRLTNETFAAVRELLAEVTPPPVQRPVPMWLGYQGPRRAADAGRLGAGLLSLSREAGAAYLAAAAAAGHPDRTARMAGVVNVVVADDPERAWQQVRRHAAHQADTYRAATSPHAEPPAPVDPEKLRPYLQTLTPADTVAHVRELTDGLPVEQVYFWADIAGMPREVADDHVRLILDEVRPALAEGASWPTNG